MAERGRASARSLALASVASLLVASGYFALSGSKAEAEAAPRPAFATPEPRAPRAEYQDLALACLTLGSLTPPIQEIEPARLERMLEALAWIFESHRTADFGAFLQLHREDLAWADEEKRADVSSLAAIIERDLGRPAAEVPQAWLPALELFWSLLYTQPVLQEVAPESARVELHVAPYVSGDASGAAGDAEPDLEPFWESFEMQRTSHVRRINHDIALPHRRTPEQLTRELGELVWFDFQVDVVLGEEERLPCSILVRFVWDGLDQDWFLARAVTIYPDRLEPGSTRSLLLF